MIMWNALNMSEETPHVTPAPSATSQITFAFQNSLVWSKSAKQFKWLKSILKLSTFRANSWMD